MTAGVFCVCHRKRDVFIVVIGMGEVLVVILRLVVPGYKRHAKNDCIFVILHPHLFRARDAMTASVLT